jgi:hypothetical protein
MVTTIIVLLSLTGITEGNTLSSWIQTDISIPFFFCSWAFLLAVFMWKEICL